MKLFSLFELLLTVFAFYASIEFKGGVKILVVLLCLGAVFLIERLEKRKEEDEEVRARLLRYAEADRKKKTQAAQTKPEAEGKVATPLLESKGEDHQRRYVDQESGKGTKESPH